MKIDLRNLDETSGEVTGSDCVQFKDAMDETVELACSVRVRYTHTGGAFYLHVSTESGFETSCHRCLDPVTVPLDAEFDLVIRRGVDREEGRTDGAKSEDYITVGANEHEVSLHPFIHENTVVNIPMLILCSEDCKGLCPECGENRNRTQCNCKPARDSRWDALRRVSGD
jgi:uncharacterized metal-binding protein YceD (DUF177 family)